MSNKIFVIKNEKDGIIAFYSTLEKAQNELKKIYKTIFNFKHDYYEINVYDLVDNEYILTNISYTYYFDTFLIKNIV